MKNKILNFIDFEKMDILLEGFHKSTGFATAILDLDGNVLSKSGWRQICTEFHRINSETYRKCRISDTELANKMVEGEKYYSYNCLNGLVDVAVPIVLKGEHVANLFSGQFFFEEPDKSFFQKQAAKYGFNKDKYLEALGKVPVVSKDKVKTVMDFLLSMTQLISETTLQKLEQAELNKSIRKSQDALRESEKQYAFLANSAFELVDFTSSHNIYEYTVRKLHELLEGKGVVAAVEYMTDTNRWKMQHIEGVQNRLSVLSKVLGFDLMQMEGDISTKFYDKITSGKLVEVDFDFPALFNNKLSKKIGKAVKNILSVDKMHCIAFQQNEKVFGNITIITNKESKPLNIELIEAFVLQVTNFVKKHKSEEALRHSQERFRIAQDMSPDGFTILRPMRDNYGRIVDFTFVYENPAVARLNGTDPEAVTGKRLLELFPCHRGTPLIKAYQQVAESGKACIFETDNSCETIIKPTSLRIVVVPMEGDIAILAQDITERRKTEMILQMQYKIANSAITAKSLNKLLETIHNELNSVIDARNIFIVSYDEKTGMFNSIVDKDEKDEIAEWPAEKSLTGYVIRQNRPVLLRKNEIIRLHEEGIIELIGTIPEAWLGVPLKIEGEVFGAIVVQSYVNPDIYDHSSIEILELVAKELSSYLDRRRAREKAVKLSRAVEQSSVSVVIANKEGCVEYVNPFFTKLTGYSLEEVIGKNLNILKSGHQPKELYEELWNTILSGKDWEGELWNKKKNGDLYWEKAVISPIVNSKGVITNFVVIKENITERKQLLEDLVLAKEKAEESDMLKTAFINNISHEIRTPLNGILGSGQLLAESELTPDKRMKYYDIIKESSNRLMNTVADYMDMAMIFSGTLKINKTEFLLQPFLEEIIEDHKQLFAEKKIDFDALIPTEAGNLILNSDSEFICKILNILFDNALKFTEQGSVKFGYRVTPGFLEFFVQDTGIGIAPDKLDVIFDMFSQEDSSSTRGYEGNGLGLTIARGLVELLGGAIIGTSEKGEGSSFTFTVPYGEPALPVKPATTKTIE